MASFGYQVLGFGSGGAAALGPPFDCEYLVVAGAGSGGSALSGAGGGGGGYRVLASKTFPLEGASSYTVTVGGGGDWSGPGSVPGDSGGLSTLSTITSA